MLNNIMANLECPSTDINFLSPNSFRFNIERLPGVSFFAQEVQIPGISIIPLEEATPLTSMKLPSDRLDFEPLQIPFIVDEQMKNWNEVFRWMRGLGLPEKYEQYREVNQSRGFADQNEEARNYSDATLIVLNSSNTPVKTLFFKECYPLSMSSIQLATTNTDVQYAICTLTLEYNYYTVE